MNEMMQAMMVMSSQRTIKVELFSGKQMDYPEWGLKQKNNFVMADLGHVREETFLGKLPRRESIELNDSTAKTKE